MRRRSYSVRSPSAHSEAEVQHALAFRGEYVAVHRPDRSPLPKILPRSCVWVIGGDPTPIDHRGCAQVLVVWVGAGKQALVIAIQGEISHSANAFVIPAKDAVMEVDFVRASGERLNALDKRPRKVITVTGIHERFSQIGFEVALAGADASLFERYPAEGTPTWTVYREAQRASFIELLGGRFSRKIPALRPISGLN